MKNGNEIINQAIHLLSSVFSIDCLKDNHNIPLSTEEYFLDALQYKIEEILKEKNKNYFETLENIKEIRKALLSLTYSELTNITYGIDYNLELRIYKPYVTKENYSVLFYCLIALPKFGDERLVGENHGYGYHIHYVVIKKSKQIRTNILLTFNPNETKADNHTLYWEEHGGGVSKRPCKFRDRRRIAIYDSSCTFLSKIKKTDFRRLGGKSKILWPR